MMSNVTTGMQDESELLLRELDDDSFWSAGHDAGAVVASPAGESYDSKESSSDGDAPACLCVDLGTSLVHSRARERLQRNGRK